MDAIYNAAEGDVSMGSGQSMVMTLDMSQSMSPSEATAVQVMVMPGGLSICGGVLDTLNG